jgi:hypothetical protein
MDDDMKARLAALFPGDLDPSVPVVVMHGPSPFRELRLRMSEPLKRVPAKVTRPASERTSRLAETRTLPPPPATIDLPVAPLPAKKLYLLEPANAALWVREAEEIEHALTVGEPTDCHHITRLMLEAIPVVKQVAKRP